ncbi:MAG: hypothetical protein ACE5JL_09445 [Dehalococcoidia bacterium]
MAHPEQKETTEKPEEETAREGQPERRWYGLERSDLELIAWVVAGFVIGVALKVTTASAIIITVVVLVAIARLYYEGTQRSYGNPRPGIGMAPLFLLGWGLGLFVRALVS